MAYDVELADRLRAMLSSEPDLAEKQMFGGLAFLVAGRLAVGVSGQGRLMLRVPPAERDELVMDPRVSPFVMSGREVAGWLRIEADDDTAEDDLARWVGIGTSVARSLPPR